MHSKTQVVILCGGQGTRLRERTEELPKPMVEIGGMPILWHIMKSYSHYGFREFILCLGYKADKIKEFFLNFREWHKGDFTLEWGSQVERLRAQSPEHTEDWKITFAETGSETNTGGRVKRIEKYIHDSPFFLTYGDGLANINFQEQMKHHKKHKRCATLTCVQPKSQYGIVEMNEQNVILRYLEKPKMKQWVNGGFFVFNKEIFKYICENEILEREPLERLEQKRELVAYPFHEFWACMDTYKDTQQLNDLWNRGEAPWKSWPE